MTTLIFTRPHQWAKMKHKGIKLVHAPVFGPSPMLRGGAPMGDSVGGVATQAGLTKLIELFEEHKPDAFLFWAMYGMGDVDRRQLESVQIVLTTCKAIAPKCKFFYGNGNQASTILERSPDFNVMSFKSVIDVVLDTTRDSGIHGIYSKHGFGVDTLHTFGFDPDDIEPMHGPLGGVPKKAEHDVFFGGSYTGRRRFPNSDFRHNLLITLAKKFDLLVRGRGKWPVPSKPYVHAMDYAKEIGKCKVALGCYHDDLERYYTKRTIYSLASGRPYVVRYIPEMEKDFRNFWNWGQLLHFQTSEEACSLIRMLLNEPKLANEIGRRGRKIAVEKHSWAARLKDMGEILKW